MNWSFVLTQLMLNGKAGGTLIWVAQGSILIHLRDVSMHHRFALVSSNLQVSSSPTKKVQVSTANLLQTDSGYQLKFTPRHFCLDFKLGPWYEFILWHPPFLHLPFFGDTLRPDISCPARHWDVSQAKSEDSKIQGRWGSFCWDRGWWPDEWLKHLCWWNRKIGANGAAERYGLFCFLVWQIVVQQNWKYLPCV